MILHSYAEQVMTMCSIQERQLSLLYFLSNLPLMIKAKMPSTLYTVSNIFMRVYGCVEEVVTMCLVYKIWRLLALVLISTPPPTPTPHPHPILDLDSLSKFTY